MDNCYLLITPYGWHAICNTLFQDAYSKILAEEEEARSGHGRAARGNGQKDL